MGAVSGWVKFAFKNLAVPAGFYFVFHFYGAKPAIGLAVVSTVIFVVADLARGIELSPFFIVAAVFTVVFGSMDLALPHPRFFRLEPFAQNLIIGLVFWGSLAIRRPIVTWFAASLPEAVRPSFDPKHQRYFRKVTAVWAAYFCVKAVVFLIIAFHVDLAQLVVWRSIIGGSTLALLFGGEIIYRKRVLERP